MKHTKFLRILITIGLVFFGIFLLGMNPENQHIEKVTMLGIVCLLIAWALNSIGVLQSKQGLINLINTEIVREIKEFEKKLEDQPSPQGTLKLAEMFLKIGQPKKTLEILEKYSTEITEDLKAQYLKMISYFGLKDYSKAWEYIEKIYEKDEAFDEHKIKLWAARCYIELLEPEHSLKFVDLYIEKTGISAEAFYTKAIAYSRSGDSENAKELLAELEKMQAQVPKMRQFEIKILIKALQKEMNEAK